MRFRCIKLGIKSKWWENGWNNWTNNLAGDWVHNFCVVRDYFPEETTEHKYTFKNLPDGDYNIEITCWDEIGNSANAQTDFKVEIDKIPPKVVRAYYKNGKLNLITNEVAECYYDFEMCEFTINNKTRKFDSTIAGYSTEHNTDWITGQTYHIKCRDIWGNPNTDCAIKVIPSHSFQI